MTAPPARQALWCTLNPRGPCRHCRRKWLKQCCLGYRRQRRPGPELCARTGWPCSTMQSFPGGAFSRHFRERRRLPCVSWGGCEGDLYTSVEGTPMRLVRLSTERGRRYLWNVPLPLVTEGRAELSDILYCLAWHRERLLCCSYTIWMLDNARKVWVEIAGSCPPDILPPGDLKTQYLSLKKVQVSGDLWIFFYKLLDKSDVEVDLVECPVAYDMLRRFWLKVPQIVAQVGGRDGTGRKCPVTIFQLGMLEA